MKSYPIFRIREDQIVLPDGNTGMYVVLEAPDGCHIIAMTEDHRIPLVCQYRYGAARTMLELPSGMVDADEKPLDAAKRELREETGCTGDQWIALGAHCINAACQTNLNHCFLAMNVQLTHPQQLGHDERIQVEWFTLPEVFHFIEIGEIVQASAICAFYKYGMINNSLRSLHLPPSTPTPTSSSLPIACPHRIQLLPCSSYASCQGWVDILVPEKHYIFYKYVKLAPI